MSKKKFQLVPPKEIKANLNSLESLLTRQSDKEFIKDICSNAHPEVLMELINKKMLGTGIEPTIELTTEALIVNLCSHQQYKGRQYTLNKLFTRFIEVYGGIIIGKIYPTDPRITCKKPNEAIVKVISTENRSNIDQSKNVWTSYAEALLNLHNYKYKSENTVTPKDVQCIKNSFLLIIKSIDKSTLFMELFLDFTKVIGSIDQETLTAIRNTQLFKESIILSQNLTQYFIDIHNIEEAKYFFNITELLIRSSQLHKIDKQQDFAVLQANHYWNNGMILKAENKHLEAKGCFEEYYEHNPDQDTVVILYGLYTKIGDYNKAEALFNKHSDALPCVKRMKDVLNNQEYTDLQLIKDFCYTDKHSIVLTNLKLAISLNDKEQIEYYRLILKDEVIAKKEEFNKISLEFQAEARLLLDNRVKNVSVIIKKLHSDITSALFYKLSVLYSNGFNYDIALKYIDLAISYKSNDPLYLLHKHILEAYKELLDNPQESYPEKQAETEHKELPEKQAEIEHKKLDEITPSNDEASQIEKRVPKEKTRPTQTLPSYEDIIDSYDPKEIDQYFKLIKKILLEQSINPVNKDQDAGWIIEKIKIKLSDAINIFPNLYTAIDPSLESDIDLSKWENILRKGFTSRKNAENGIKQLKPGVYEAKDCSKDVRLVAYKTYINEDHKKLMLFTEQMNHKEVIKCNITPEEIGCPNYNNELSLIGASSMDE